MLTTALLALAAAQAGPDEWRPRTVPLVGASYTPDIGLILGLGISHTRYGFRALPASTRLVAQLEYATAVQRFRAGVAGEFRRPLAPAIVTFEVRASGLELVRFYGFGNASDGSLPDSVYRVRQSELLAAPALTVRLAPRLRLTLGPLLQFTRTSVDSGTVLGSTGPYYGTGDFGDIGARAVLDLDTRDQPVAAARGWHLWLAGRWYPGAWDAVDPFGTVSAEVATYLSAGDPPAATLALRAGGATESGTVPFQEAVYVGGETTVRGYAEQRFAGQTGAYGNAELRLRVAFLTAGDLGVLGLADAGRVWVANESSDRWHAAAGGGVWFAWRHRRDSILSLALARSPERTALYVRAGFMF